MFDKIILESQNLFKLLTSLFFLLQVKHPHHDLSYQHHSFQLNLRNIVEPLNISTGRKVMLQAKEAFR